MKNRSNYQWVLFFLSGALFFIGLRHSTLILYSDSVYTQDFVSYSIITATFIFTGLIGMIIIASIEKKDTN